MAKSTSKKKRPAVRRKKNEKPVARPKLTLRQRFRRRLKAAKKRQDDFLKRRPHRSFRLTRRRDYKRSLKLPGYWSLTAQVLGVMKKNWRLYIRISLTFALLTLLLSSIMSQETYAQLKEVMDEANQDNILGNVIPTLTIFWGVLTGQLAGTSAGAVGSSQQIFGVLIGLFAWLTVVWLLRSIMAGRKPKMRDGIYSSGGPVLALLVLVFVLLIQLLPMAISLIVYGAASTSGLLDQTAMLMLFGGGAILLAALSIYWATSTVIAMVIVALPGMYPFEAIRLAGDLVVGRRIRILLRLLWSVVLLLIIWAVVVIPIILLDGALKSSIPDLEWLPLVPISALLMMAFSIVFMSSYVYIFYRKVVEDDSSPA